VGSYRFDSYGSPGKRVCLIKNNVVTDLLADKRYSDYLGVPVTGEMGNMEVEAGSTSFKDLLDPTRGGKGVLYHLQAFSAFEPNSITGAFSAEIRAGYEISAAGVKPIKGGSVSGVLQKAMESCWFSTERIQRERSLVPKGIVFESLDIAGS